MDTARGRVGDAKRGNLSRLQNIIHEEARSIVHMFTNFVWVVRDNVQYWATLQNNLSWTA